MNKLRTNVYLDIIYSIKDRHNSCFTKIHLNNAIRLCFISYLEKPYVFYSIVCSCGCFKIAITTVCSNHTDYDIPLVNTAPFNNLSIIR